MAKYVFVTGGVTSSLGKGITAASVGRLLAEERTRLVSIAIAAVVAAFVAGLPYLSMLFAGR